ncbi:MAG: prolipoprotein diacylglyceryl transferase [Elusimicrobia bacterium]|nr:prolipoprotein diacylglyceryl transferase [Elusimicrobiota bacterium]
MTPLARTDSAPHAGSDDAAAAHIRYNTPVHPILLNLGPLRLYGYGAAITLGGVIVARLLWLRRAKMGLPDDESFWTLINLAVLSGFLGGKLLFLLQYGRRDLSIMNGYSAFGGFIGLSLCAALFARWKRIPVLKLADYLFLCGAFWHAFGRVGCFLAGCCHGRPTGLPWGVVFRDPGSMVPPELLGVALHPVQLYEAAGDLLIASVLWPVLRATEEGRYRPGLVVAGHFAAYGVLRFGLEFLRGDTLPFLGPFSQGQALGLGLVASSAGIMAWRRRCSPSC